MFLTYSLQTASLPTERDDVRSKDENPSPAFATSGSVDRRRRRGFRRRTECRSSVAYSRRSAMRLRRRGCSGGFRQVARHWSPCPSNSSAKIRSKLAESAVTPANFPPPQRSLPSQHCRGILLRRRMMAKLGWLLFVLTVAGSALMVTTLRNQRTDAELLAESTKREAESALAAAEKPATMNCVSWCLICWRAASNSEKQATLPRLWRGLI
jgi:hypothetical protein